MKKFNIILFFFSLANIINAQFINNGATVTIQSGATLRVESDFQNNSTGTVTNNGTIEIMGNFTNASTAILTPAVGLIKFIGTGNTNLDTGGEALNNVEMAKTAGANVTLTTPLTINGNLSFTGVGSKMVLGAHDVTLGSASVVNTPGTAGYVVTDGVGSFIKKVSSNGTFTFPIGDDVSDYSPLSLTFTGTGYSGTSSIKSRVIDAVHPSKPSEADSYITRYWRMDASNITAPFNATMVGTYLIGDNVGTQSRIKGASFISPDWSFAGAATNGTSTITGVTSNTALDFTGMNSLNKLNITAFLFGTMPGSGTIMTNDLQTYSPCLLPTTSPYGSPSSQYTDISNPSGVAGNIVDWIKVEIRDGSNPGSILETRSLLLKTNGSIVGTDGNVPFFKDQTVPVRVSLSHRNHLVILSNTISGVFAGKNESYNFSTSLSQASNDFNDPDQMKLKNGKWCMIDSDINNDFTIDGIDLASVKFQFNLGTFDSYTSEDINCDGVVDGIDLTLAKIAFNAGYFSTLINF